MQDFHQADWPERAEIAESLEGDRYSMTSKVEAFVDTFVDGVD